ncbi:MAG: hypothetical protein M0P74_00245 [Syntrophales bacterium]|jgi:hypothetical protein|nr:hypothetical protein [Syntrophales bacterium]
MKKYSISVKLGIAKTFAPLRILLDINKVLNSGELDIMRGAAWVCRPGERVDKQSKWGEAK